jgi:hypothetical protein
MITIYAVETAYEGIDPESFTFSRLEAEYGARADGRWVVEIEIGSDYIDVSEG